MSITSSSTTFTACGTPPGNDTAPADYILWPQFVEVATKQLQNSDISKATIGSSAWHAIPPVTDAFSCLLLGNSVTGGVGGDVALLVDVTSRSSLAVTNAYSLMARAARGGSIAAVGGSLTIDSCFFNSSTAEVTATAGTGTGGAVAAQAAPDVRIYNSTFLRTTAKYGGAYYVRAVDADLAASFGDGAVGLTLGYLRAIESIASAGGAGFILSGVNETYACEECDLAGASATGYGPEVASQTVRLAMYQPDGTTLLDFDSAIPVPSSAAINSPLALLVLTDGFDQASKSDNTTACVITVTNAATNSILGLGFSNRYVAVNGVVRLFPFSVSAGPNLNLSATVMCTVEDGMVLQAVTLKLQSTTVALRFTAATTASQISVLPSTLTLSYASAAIAAEVVDGGGIPVTISVTCNLMLQSAVTRSGSVASGSIAGLVTANTVGSTVSFQPYLRFPGGTTVYVNIACQWPTGESITTAGTQAIKVHELSLKWRVGAVGTCGSNESIVPNFTVSSLPGYGSGTWASACAALRNKADMSIIGSAIVTFIPSAVVSTELLLWSGNSVWILRDSLWVANNTDALGKLPLPAALPSPPGVPALMQTLMSYPAAVLMYTHAYSGATHPVPLEVTTSCRLSTDSLTAGTVAASLTSGGTASLTNATVLFDSTGLQNAAFGDLVALKVACDWPGGETLSPRALVIGVDSLTVEVMQAPSPVLLPSDEKGQPLLLLNPRPAYRLQVQKASGQVVPAPAQALDCKASLESVTVDLAATGTILASLVGLLDARSNAADGTFSFPLLGVTGLLGTSAKLGVACNWLVQGQVAVNTAVPLRLPRLAVTIINVTSWTSLPVITSAPGLGYLSPPPSIRLSLLPGEYDAGGSIRLDTLAKGSTFKCSVSTTASSGTSAVGTTSIVLTLSSESSSVVVFDRLGIAGQLGASYGLTFTCLWTPVAAAGGRTVSTASGSRLSSLRLGWLTEPVGTLLPTTAALLTPLSQTPAVEVLSYDTAVGAASELRLMSYRLPCEIASIAATGQGSTLMLLQGSTSEVGSLVGTVNFPTAALVGPLQARLRLRIKCFWGAGERIELTSTDLETPAINVTFQFMPERAFPSTVNSLSVLNPFPSVRLVQVSSSGVVRPLATPLDCTAAVVALNVSIVSLVGQGMATSGTDGIAQWSSMGVIGPLGASFYLSVSCPWLTGQPVVRAQSGIATLEQVVASFVVMPPASIVPSAGSGGKVKYMLPPPVVSIQLADNATSLASLRPVCTVTASTLTGGMVTLVGGLTTAADETGRAAFARIAAAGPFGATFRIISTCAFANGDSVPVSSGIITLRTVVLAPLAALPALVLPSSVSAPLPLQPAPAVQLLSKWLGNAMDVDELADGFEIDCLISLSDPTACNGTLPTGVQLVGTLASKSSFGGLATFPNVAIVSPFGRCFSMTVTCTWVGGQASSVATSDIQTPRVQTTWGAADGSTPAPPQIGLHNTCIPDFAVQLSYRAASLGPSAPWSTAWLALSPGEVRCVLSSNLVGAIPVTQTGSSTVSSDNEGTVRYAGIALLPTLGMAIPGANLTVMLTSQCTMRAQSLAPSAPAPLQLLGLNASFKMAPPVAVLSSSQVNPVPLFPTVETWIVPSGNANFPIPPSDSVGVCTVTVGAQRFAPWVLPKWQIVNLIGTSRSVMSEGVAAFPALSVFAALGCQAELIATCVRAAGGEVATVSRNVTFLDMNVTWVLSPPLLVLYGTEYTARVIVQQYVPNASHPEWAPVQGSYAPLSGVACAVHLTQVQGSVGITSLTSGDSNMLATTDENGTATFTVSLIGLPDAMGDVYIQCTAADQPRVTSSVRLAIDGVEPYFIAGKHPPALWLPTSGLARTPVRPAPAVLLRTRSGLPVDSRGVTCRASIVAGGRLVEPPPDGYKATLSVAEDGNTSISSAAIGFYNAPIELIDMLIEAPLGAILALKVTCTRSEGDTGKLLVTTVRMYDPVPVWLVNLPASIAPDKAIGASIALIDRPYLQLANAVVMAAHSATNQSAPVLTASQGLITLDSVSTCAMHLHPGQPSSVQLNNGAAAASAGVITLRGATILATVGSTVTGNAECSLGLSRMNDTLEWSINLEPCGPGFAGIGTTGYSCAQCPEQTYSTGGFGAVCTKCPARGVDCAGGILQLQEGYFRADTGRTIDETTELHPCFFDNGCIVNLSSAIGDRSAQNSHTCAPGYEGALCGVCSSRGAANGGFARVGQACAACWDVGLSMGTLALIPIGMLALAVFIVNRDIDETSPAAIILRIFLSYVQTLGTLGAVYLAKGTQTFRENAAVTEFLGSSPFSASPVQCMMRPSYYTKFYATVALPFILAFMGLIILLVQKKLQPFVDMLKSWLEARVSYAHLTLFCALFCTFSDPRAARRGKLNGNAQDCGRMIANPLASSSIAQAPDNVSVGNIAATVVGAATRSPTTSRRAVLGRSKSSSSRMSDLFPGTPTGTGAVARYRSTSFTLTFMPMRLRRGSSGDVDGPGLQQEQGQANNVPWGKQVWYSLRGENPWWKQPWWLQLRGEVVAPFLFMMNLGYTSITTTAFTVFKCTESSVGGHQYLIADLSLRCDTPVHVLNIIIAGVIVALMGLGIPLLFALLLRKHKHSLRHPTVFKKFGFLYDGYDVKRNMYAFESLILVRKALIVAIGSLITDAYFQIISSTLLMVAYLALTAAMRPYAKQIYNQMEILTLMCIIVTQVTCIFYLRSEALITSCGLTVPGEYIPTGQSLSCAVLRAGKKQSELGTTAVLTLVNAATAMTLFATIIFLTLRQSAISNPHGIVATILGRFCHKAVQRATAKHDAESEELSQWLKWYDLEQAKKAARQKGDVCRTNQPTSSQRARMAVLPAAPVIAPVLLPAGHRTDSGGGSTPARTASNVKGNTKVSSPPTPFPKLGPK